MKETNLKNGKAVLVTGVCGGMGKATAMALKQEGYTVYGIDRPREEPVDFCRFLGADVTKEEDLVEAFRQISAETPTLYAVIHTAGIYVLDSLVELTEEEFLRVFNVNLFGIARVNRIFLPLLQKGGRIVMTTSELAPLDPLPFTGIYAVTKAALEKYAYSLRMELNLLGLSVSLIRPGAVRTGLLGVSTAALDRFCKETKLYPCNAARFHDIVDKVEAKSVPPTEVAKIAVKALAAKHPRYVYNLNRNPLLKLLNMLPQHLQVFIIQKILETPQKQK